MDWLSHLFCLCMSILTYESSFSRMDWLSHLCFLMHEPFLLLNLPSHVWIVFLTYAFGHMSLFTYESTFSRIDWLSHLCVLTHETFHLWIYILLSHVWIDSLTCAFSRTSLFTYESTFSRMFDWCCFDYFVTNSLVALLEALCAPIFSLDSWMSVFFDISFSFFCVCKVSNKAFLLLLSTRLLCLVLANPRVRWLYMCACVCVPLYVHVKMCR